MEEAADDLTNDQVAALRDQLAKLAGVIEAVVLPLERTVILKIDKSQLWDEAQMETLVHQLLRG